MTGQDVDQRRIEHAVITWARSVFGAPRQLHTLVTGIERRDEIIERVATSVVRRELREMRSPTGERRSTRPRVDASTVDPFAYTSAALRADSEYVTQCDACAASGLMRCDGCTGSGVGRCLVCRGSGKQRSEKTGRPINCKSCKASGSASCRPCGGRGSIPCRTCLGSGHQLTWLTLEQTERCEIAIPGNSPVVLAHRALCEGRPLAAGDVAALSIVEDQAADGPLGDAQLSGPDRRVVHAQLALIDRRYERVRHQQYLKLAVVRRDVTFEMCGTRATLALSGTSLVGATTPEVLRPIKRRLYAWAALCMVVAVLAGVLRDALFGASSYFADARAIAGGLAIAAAICAIPMFGAVLRAWRGGLLFHPMRWTTRAWSAGVVVALSSIVVVGVAARPAAEDVTRALAKRDVARARAVIDAIRERAGASRAVLDLEDQVLLAEAANQQGRDRLALLDAVAAHQGAAAAHAAADASTQRLDEVRALIAAQHPTEALAVLDRAFAGDKTVVVAEERARAHEAALAACTTATCQLAEAIQANAARSTPDRASATAAARARVLDALDVKRAEAPDLVQRLQRLHQLSDSATAARTIALDDNLLQDRARAAQAYADTARRAVPLLGNRLAAAEQLLGASTRSPTGLASFELEGGTLYLAIDKAGICTGVYAVGSSAASRTLASKTAERILSQAIGKPTAISVPTNGQSQSRWFAGGARVVARWEAGALVELRIGDAAPW